MTEVATFRAPEFGIPCQHGRSAERHKRGNPLIRHRSLER